MPSAKMANEPGHITTGNVLEDLGFSPQEIREMEIKHDLWVPIRAEIESRKLTQAKLVQVLQIHQPDASLLLRGQIERFSITRLLQFADCLQLAVTFHVSPIQDRSERQTGSRTPMRRAAQQKRSNKASKAPAASRKTAVA